MLAPSLILSPWLVVIVACPNQRYSILYSNPARSIRELWHVDLKTDRQTDSTTTFIVQQGASPSFVAYPNFTSHVFP